MHVIVLIRKIIISIVWHMNILKYFISVVLDNLKIKYVLTEVKMFIFPCIENNWNVISRQLIYMCMDKMIL